MQTAILPLGGNVRTRPWTLLAWRCDAASALVARRGATHHLVETRNPGSDEPEEQRSRSLLSGFSVYVFWYFTLLYTAAGYVGNTVHPSHQDMHEGPRRTLIGSLFWQEQRLQHDQLIESKIALRAVPDRWVLQQRLSPKDLLLHRYRLPARGRVY